MHLYSTIHFVKQELFHLGEMVERTKVADCQSVVRIIRTEGLNPSLSVRSLLRITMNLSTERKRLIKLDTFFHYSLRPGLRPGSFDRNPKIKREMKISLLCKRTA
jgi:hypothetical protein